MSFSRRRCDGSSIRYIPVGMPIARMITPMASHGLTMNKMRPIMIPAMANFIRPDNFCLLRRRGYGSRPARDTADPCPAGPPHPRLLSETPAGRHVVPRPPVLRMFPGRAQLPAPLDLASCGSGPGFAGTAGAGQDGRSDQEAVMTISLPV